MIGHRFRRRGVLPIGHHRILHPAQINGVIDMAHMVNVCRCDCNIVPIHHAIPIFTNISTMLTRPLTGQVGNRRIPNTDNG
jgi:hypothetical protein